jgi:hypothetical protein
MGRGSPVSKGEDTQSEVAYSLDSPLVEERVRRRSSTGYTRQLCRLFERYGLAHLVDTLDGAVVVPLKGHHRVLELSAR